jgi:hypothetical protein
MSVLPRGAERVRRRCSLAPAALDGSAVRESSPPGQDEGGNEGEVQDQKPSQAIPTHHTDPPGPDVTNPRARSEDSSDPRRKKWWTGRELNPRHRDFQSRSRTGGIPILPPVLTRDKVCE